MEDEIFFNQSKYIKEMLKKFGLEVSKPTKTLMSTEIKLTKSDDADSVDSSKYQDSDVVKNMKKSGQAPRGVPVGPKMDVWCAMGVNICMDRHHFCAFPYLDQIKCLKEWTIFVCNKDVVHSFGCFLHAPMWFPITGYIGHGDLSSALVLGIILDEFSLSSGFHPSRVKSGAFCCCVPHNIVADIKMVMPFDEGTLPIKYQGVPMVSKRLGDNDYNILVYIMKKRIVALHLVMIY
ncbi:hypothetical protein Tco_1430146 [Tanacetum coccineum]